MKILGTICVAGVLGLAVGAGAVGVENQGTFRVRTIEKTPAPISENVRIEPPPTGGNLEVSIRADRPRYHVGDPVKIIFGVNRDAFVYIFNTDATGITRQIFPNYYDVHNFVRAGKTYYIPDRSYDMEATGPSGNESLTIVATTEDFPFLAEYKNFSRSDPYPASREGATALVRRIESFRVEPSAMEIQPVRPAPKANWWASESTTFYVMDRERVPPPTYKVARYGSLDVDTYPSNARIYIDSDYYGRSSQVIERLEIGYHHILLEKEGYQPYECNIYIKGNQTKELDIFLHETAEQPGYSRGDKPSGINGFGFFKQDAE